MPLVIQLPFDISVDLSAWIEIFGMSNSAIINAIFAIVGWVAIAGALFYPTGPGDEPLQDGFPYAAHSLSRFRRSTTLSRFCGSSPSPYLDARGSRANHRTRNPGRGLRSQ